MAESIEQIETMLASAGDEAEAIRALSELASRLNESDPKRGLTLARDAYERAATIEDRHAMAASLRIMANCHHSLSEYSTAMKSAQRARELFEELGDRSGVANALISIGVIARSMTSYGASLEALNQALAIFTENDDRPRMAAAYNNIGTVHNAIGNLTEALEAYLASLRIYEELGEELTAAAITSNIGIVYYYLRDVDLAFQYHSRGLEVFRRLGAAYNEAIALGNLSSIYKERGDIGAALDAVERELALFQQLGERRYQAASRVKLGMLYQLQGRGDEAMEQLQCAAAMAREIGHLEVYSDAENRIGDFHRERGEHNLAIAALTRALAAAGEARLTKSMADIELALAEAYEGAGDPAGAYPHLKRFTELRETILGEERQRAIAEMQTRFDVEHAERERELFRLKSEHLEAMMEQRAKEFTTLAMHLVQKNTFLQKLRKDTLRLAKEYPEAKGAFEEIVRATGENLKSDNDWQRFEQEFRQVHHGFVQMLSERYPRLTPTELKVCALLKINLSNKEIGKLLSVSLRNVESHRYAIRKKLELPSDVNLSSYLASL